MNSHTAAWTRVHIAMAGTDDSLLFHPLLRRGVDVEVHLGTPVREILSTDLQFPDRAIEEDIQSIFLDGHPVDDIQGTRIWTEGSILSLSAAMPGLVGASMRRGGAYAGLRQSISWQENAYEQAKGETGFIELKLFNFLVPALGPVVLTRGVRLEAARLAEALEQGSDDERAAIMGLRVDGTGFSLQEGVQRLVSLGTQSVFVQVETGASYPQGVESGGGHDPVSVGDNGRLHPGHGRG